jgi:anti-anti-sigma factor
MNAIEYSTPQTVFIADMAELVKGQENTLVERVIPLVRNHSVRLDLRRVERIDAAGITALITLYRAAHDAGHEFTIARAAPRVKEILDLVGLLHLLEVEPEEATGRSSLPLECTHACM